jgi:hypothetical protein
VSTSLHDLIQGQIKKGSDIGSIKIAGLITSHYILLYWLIKYDPELRCFFISVK